MSVVGIDLGLAHSVLATVHRGAVSIVRNDVSERLTPSVAGYTDKERIMGDTATAQIKSNLRNTCRGFKQLLARSMDDPLAQREAAFSLSQVVADPVTGVASYAISHKGEKRVFTATAVMAAFLTKLKEMAEISTNETVKDVVIAVPGWFKDVHRQAAIDAAQAAGLNCLRTINEHAAVMLDFGIYRARTFDENKPCRVAFVGMGHANSFAAVGEFRPGEFRVLSAEYDAELGGRDLDQLLMNHCAREFEAKHKINPLQNTKARLKLEEACGKAKKVLSTNKEAFVGVECLLEDIDLAVTVQREDFEKAAEPFSARFLALMEACLEGSQLKLDEIESVEIVGGGVRVPWAQEAIKDFFGKELSRTLHGDESVARGAALQAAMLNPRYKVRDFAVNDKYFNHVCLNYASTTATETGEHPTKTYTLFDAKSGLNVRKYVTLQRDDSFDTWIGYDIKETPPPPGVDHVLGDYHVEVPPKRIVGSTGGAITSRKIKLRAVLDLNGIAYIDTASLVEDEAVKEIVKEKRLKPGSNVSPPTHEKHSSPRAPEGADKSTADADMTPPPAEGAAAPPAPPEAEYEEVEVLKESTKVHRTNLVVTRKPKFGWHTKEVLESLVACEATMVKDDAHFRATRDTMNALEAYAYHMRDKLQNSLSQYMTAGPKAKFLESLGRVNDWIYDLGEGGTQEQFEGKLKELKSIGDVVERYHAERQGCSGSAQALISLLRQSVMACESDENAHVPEASRVEVMTKAQLVEAWVTEALEQNNRVPLHESPKLTMAMIQAQEDEFREYFKSRMDVPKPQEKKEEKPADAADVEMAAEEPLADAQQ